MDSFDIGSEFATYNDFRIAVDRYEKSTLAAYCVKNSDKAEKANVKRRNKVPESFVIARAHYVCSHFGTVRLRQTTSGGVRQTYKTTKLGCEASFIVHYNDRKGKLVVTKFCGVHNHPMNKDTFLKERKNKTLELVDSSQKQSLKEEIVELNPNNSCLQGLINQKFHNTLRLTDVRALQHHSSTQLHHPGEPVYPEISAIEVTAESEVQESTQQSQRSNHNGSNLHHGAGKSVTSSRRKAL